MRIIDIGQEVFGCRTYPGDPLPGYEKIKEMSKGAVCNSSRFWMGVHNGTHLDAPAHFIQDGRTADQLRLEDCVGEAWVVSGEEGWEKRIPEGCERLLVRLDEEITLEQAKILVEKGLRLIGTQAQKMGNQDVHRELLGHGIVMLEGARLAEAPDGKTFLCAQPMNLGGAEGAPCRPVLLYW